MCWQPLPLLLVLFYGFFSRGVSCAGFQELGKLSSSSYSLLKGSWAGFGAAVTQQATCCWLEGRCQDLDGFVLSPVKSLPGKKTWSCERCPPCCSGVLCAARTVCSVSWEDVAWPAGSEALHVWQEQGVKPNIPIYS